MFSIQHCVWVYNLATYVVFESIYTLMFFETLLKLFTSNNGGQYTFHSLLSHKPQTHLSMGFICIAFKEWRGAWALIQSVLFLFF